MEAMSPLTEQMATTPPDLLLRPQSLDAHPGKVWVRTNEDGLTIEGEVQVKDNDLHWPQEKSEMLASDHVEIWLSATKDVPMPPVGYGNQFGENDLKSAADCVQLESEDGPGSPRSPKVKDCERWYAAQVQYRKQFARLFTRQWLAAGNVGSQASFFEDFASSAWDDLNASFYKQELPDPLRPKGDERIHSEFSSESAKQITLHNAAGTPYTEGIVTGYTFTFFIPYSAFPPTRQLALRDLWVMVDVFGAAPEGKKMGALSTTSPARVWGQPASFNHLALDAPRVHSLTPCAASPAEDMYGTEPAWYFPLAGKGPLYLSTVYDIENPAAGYMYDPAGVSPIFPTHELFWKTQPDGAFVCGPQLGYRKGVVTKNSKFFVEKKHFDTKTLPDGWTLVRTGPDMSTQSPFGSGACGSCPVVDIFIIYSLSPAGEVALALNINDEYTGMDNSPSAGDLALTQDWSRVTYYKETVTYIDDGRGGEKDLWTAVSYCLQGHTYKPCGTQNSVQPPTPANYPEMRGDDQDSQEK